MQDFIQRAITKLEKLTSAQMRALLSSAAGEIGRLETVMDSLSEGILVLDTSHALVLANRYARRVLPGVGDLGREPLWTRVPDEKAAAFLEKTLKAGDRADGWEYDALVNGIPRLFSLSVWPLVRAHEVTGSLIHLEDITEKRGREARLRRMETLASLTTLAAGMAHEIKNPLASLSIHVQLIQKTLRGVRETLPGALDTIDRYLKVTNEEIDRLNGIVVDFLFAARPLSLDLRAGDLNAFVAEVAAFVSFELEEAGIAPVLTLGENLPAVDFDERCLKQALLNLIKNAIAAMPGGGRLTLETRAVEGGVALIVADTGEGIDEASLPKIFEPYFTTKDTGSGLGLTLVYKIVREHQGEITVASKKGEGSVFTITLPLSHKERRLIGAPELPGVEGAGP